MATDAEVNELVARKLGWNTHIGFPGLWIKPGGVKKRKDHLGDFVETDMQSCLPDYCHSIVEAWEVAEKCESIVLDHGLDRETLRLRWSCVMNNAVCCIADTAPMAICLAFLKLK